MADTKIRTIRIPESLWRRARAKARREGTDVSTLVRDYLAMYITNQDSRNGSRSR